MNAERPDQQSYKSAREAAKAARKQERYARREARREIRRRRSPSGPSLFWGLMLILWAVLIYLNGRGLLATDDLWKVFLIGLGGIFIVQALVRVFDPAYRTSGFGRLVPGIMFVFVGLATLYGLNTWWPLALGLAGVALLFLSWFLQREIERRRRTQENLRESELKYRHIVDNAGSIIMEIDPQGNVTFINNFAQDFFGYTEQEIQGHNMVGTILPASDAALNEQQQMIDTIAANRSLHMEKEYVRRDGRPAWILWTYKPVFDENGRLKEVLCTGIDRTEQKRAEELAAEQMREKTAGEERTRLARDLHDAVSQTLFSASLVAEVLPRIWEQDREAGLKGLEEIRQLTRGALAEMRTLLFELRPASLADAELSELLHQLAESVMGRARLPVALEIEGECAMPPDVKIAFYRIAQEALNNIIKHAAAASACIRLKCDASGVTLCISDDGCGFNTARETGGSFGLGNMQERATAVGAAFSIDSRPDVGTRIKVVWRREAKEETQ